MTQDGNMHTKEVSITTDITPNSAAARAVSPIPTVEREEKRPPRIAFLLTLPQQEAGVHTHRGING